MKNTLLITYRFNATIITVAARSVCIIEDDESPTLLTYTSAGVDRATDIPLHDLISILPVHPLPRRK